jgi:hypothetical protein
VRTSNLRNILLEEYHVLIIKVKIIEVMSFSMLHGCFYWGKETLPLHNVEPTTQLQTHVLPAVNTWTNIYKLQLILWYSPYKL